MRILGIETSCDDTGIAIFDKKYGLITNKINKQIKIHKPYGGIIPELAARDHNKNVENLIRLALYDIKNEISTINAIAYTAGPGLINSLLVGATLGSSLAFSLKIPMIPINHMEAHLLSCMIHKHNESIKFPFIGLLVSGKHTQIIQAKAINNYTIIGNSLDDAVGETLDKIALLLGLSYPGGAKLSKIARKGKKNKFFFPRPMINQKNLNFSFSGLKTHAKKTIENSNRSNQTKSDIAKEFETAIIEVLSIKCKKALEYTGYKNLIVSGGVSANNKLRKSLKIMVKKNNKRGKVFFPNKKFCTDNGAMIAYLGFLKFKKGIYCNPCIKVNPKWSIENSYKI